MPLDVVVVTVLPLVVVLVENVDPRAELTTNKTPSPFDADMLAIDGATSISSLSVVPDSQPAIIAKHPKMAASVPRRIEQRSLLCVVMMMFTLLWVLFPELASIDTFLWLTMQFLPK